MGMMLFNELASSVLLLAPLLFAAGALWTHYRPLNALFFIVVRWLIAGLFLLSLIAVALSLSHHSTSSIIFLSLPPAHTIMLRLIMLMAPIIIPFSQLYL